MRRAFLCSVAIAAIVTVIACSSSEPSGTTMSSSSSSSSSSASSSSTSGGGGAAGDPTPPESCVKLGEHGNSKGVGEYCTPGGGQCSTFPAAGLCLADVGQTQWFCTRIGCTSNDQCGEDAVCYKDPKGSACLPSRCAPQGTGGGGGGGGGGVDGGVDGGDAGDGG
jgi:hypothetical protein